MVNLAAATREVDKLLCVNGYSGPSYVPRQDRERIAMIVRELANMARRTSCEGCAHNLGGGACRMNAEAECREGGGYELWEAGRGMNRMDMQDAGTY